MEYQKLATQALWDEKTRQEMRWQRQQQVRKAFSNWIGIFVFCLLVAASIWAFSTYDTWLPALAQNVETLIEELPGRVVYSELFPKITG